MKTIAFFNNKGGVGKTTLLYHLAWMYSELGVRTVAIDLDPQSNLTSMFLSEDHLSELWSGPATGRTIATAVAPLLEEGTGEVLAPHLETVGLNLALVPGDLRLARMEDELSAPWSDCLDGKAKAFRAMSVFHRAITLAAEEWKAELVLMDVGPNLGALNRSALLAANFIAVPLIPDLFSVQGLRNLGPTLRKWRTGWEKRLGEAPESLHDLPKGEMQPAGYIVLQHAVRQSRPVKAYLRWAERIPQEYAQSMDVPSQVDLTLDTDENCLAQLKHYRSLMPLSMEARKPIFRLKPADGAIGAHIAAVEACHDDFKLLAQRLAKSTGLKLKK